MTHDIDEDYYDADLSYRLRALVGVDRRFAGRPRQKQWVAQVPSALLLEAAAALDSLNAKVAALQRRRRP